MSKTGKKLSLILAMVLCFSLLASCGGGGTADGGSTGGNAGGGTPATSAPANPDENPAADNPNSGIKIGVVVKTMGNPLFREVAYGAVMAGEIFGCEVIPLATQQEGQIQEQIQICDDLIVQGVDALVVTPQHSDGIATAVDAAHEAGIPFISVDTAVNGAVPECFIGMDNVEAGYTVGKMVAEKIGGKGNVIILQGMAGASTSIERTEGYEKAMAEYPGITVVASQNADFQQDKAQTVMADLLQANKDISAVVCCNDLMALGAIVSLEEAGYTVGDGGVIVGSYDISVPCLEAIKAGKIYVTGYHWGKLYGYWGVQMALDAINGLEIPGHIVSPHSEITIDNVDNFLPFCEDLAAYNFN